MEIALGAELIAVPGIAAAVAARVPDPRPRGRPAPVVSNIARSAMLGNGARALNLSASRSLAPRTATAVERTSTSDPI
jgi:hypothetical protein